MAGSNAEAAPLPDGEVDDTVVAAEHATIEIDDVAKLARGREQVAEFDRLVAFDAWHRRLARDIARGEAVDHHFLEAAFVVEHVMGNADALGDRARVMDVLAGAAGTFAVGRRAIVVE